MSPDSSMRRALLLVLGVDGGDQGVILSQRPDFMAWISIHSSASAASSLGGHWCPPLNTLTRCVRRRLVSVLSRPGSSLKLKSRMPTVAKKTKGVSLLGRCAVARRKPAPQAVTPATSPGRPCAMLTATRSTGESGGVDLPLVQREARMSIGPHRADGSKTRLPGDVARVIRSGYDVPVLLRRLLENLHGQPTACGRVEGIEYGPSALRSVVRREIQDIALVCVAGAGYRADDLSARHCERLLVKRSRGRIRGLDAEEHLENGGSGARQHDRTF